MDDCLGHILQKSKQSVVLVLGRITEVVEDDLVQEGKNGVDRVQRIAELVPCYLEDKDKKILEGEVLKGIEDIDGVEFPDVESKPLQGLVAGVHVESQLLYCIVHHVDALNIAVT